MSPPEEMEKMWSIFLPAAEAPLALRALTPKGAPRRLHTQNITFTATEYPDVEIRKQAFAANALALNEQGYNIYTALNPIMPSFSGDRANKMAVSDNDIAHRQLLLIDLDRAGAAKVSATDAEIRDASEVADRITIYLRDFHGAEPIRVMSGNGIHLYFPLDLPNDEPSKDLCQLFLRALGHHFNTKTIKVDTSVFNAGQITKVPGTIARKGTATEERPFRMACVL